MKKLSIISQMKANRAVYLGLLLLLLPVVFACDLENEIVSVWNPPQEMADIRGTSPEAPNQTLPTSTTDTSKVEELFVLADGGGVFNGAITPTTFTNSVPWTVTLIYTYHWNNEKGTTPLGTISLQAADGTVFGPWETTPMDGQGGVHNAFWAASPNITLPPGTYTVIDSDPGTWSQNDKTGGAGMVWIDGVQITNP